MSASFIRPRTVPEILDAAFQILRQHYAPIVAATGIILLPSILMIVLLPPELAGLTNLVQGFLLNFASAAIVLMVADVYLGRQPDMKAALGKVGENLGDILITAIMQGFLTVLAFLACVIPGFFVAAMLFATPMVVMVEGKSGSDALGRSRELTDGSLWRVIGSSILAYVILYAALFGLGMGIGLLLGGMGRVAEVLAATLSIFALPFPVVVGTLLYFDLRIRKEGFGLDDLADLRGPELPRPGPAAY
jgi:hypothetical protein